MAYHPHAPADCRDQFRTVYRTVLNGTRVSLLALPDGSYAVKRELDPKIVQAIKDSARDQAGIWRKGAMIGKGTQAHMMPIGVMPTEVHYSLKEKYGDPTKNPEAVKAWKKHVWNNSEASAFRASEHRI